MASETIIGPKRHGPRNEYVEESPITFERFLKLSRDLDAELIDGVMVERMAANTEHEKSFAWLHSLLLFYVEHLGLGVVLGSRSAVKVRQFRGRLPDILFISKDRLSILEEQAIYGPPDLVIELVSPGDGPADVMALETDYREIGVPEMWFMDQRKHSVRAVTLENGIYVERTLTTGDLKSVVVEGFVIDVAWLFDYHRPDPLSVLLKLLER